MYMDVHQGVSCSHPGTGICPIKCNLSRHPSTVQLFMLFIIKDRNHILL
jgi:hypothetical protein